MPAEPLEAAGRDLAGAAGRHGWGLAGAASGVGRVAGQSSDAHLAVVDLVEGMQILVGDRPVRTEAMLGSAPEIGGSVAWPGAGEVDRRAPDPVVHQGHHRIAGNGIIVGETAHVWRGMPATAGALDLIV